MGILFLLFVLIIVICPVLILAGTIQLIIEKKNKFALKMIIYSLIILVIGFGGCMLILNTNLY